MTPLRCSSPTVTRLIAAVPLAAAVAACSSTGHPVTAPSSGGAASAAASTRPHSSPAPAAPRLQVRRVATLPVGVSRAVAVGSGSRLLVLAGLGPGDEGTPRVVAVDPQTGHGSVVGSLPEAVHDAAGAVLGGAPTVFGGGAATGVSAVQRWHARSGSVVGHLPGPRSDSAAAVVAGTAYVVGGFNGSGLVRSIVATRDGTHMHVVGSLRQGVRYPAVTAYGGDVWVFGGELATTEGTSGGPETAAIQRFDPRTGQIQVVGRLPRPMGHAMAFVLGGRLYVAGGRHAGVASAHIYQVSPSTGHVVAAGRLPFAFSDAGVVQAAGRVWLVGGETAGPLQPLRTVLAVTAG